MVGGAVVVVVAVPNGIDCVGGGDVVIVVVVAGVVVGRVRSVDVFWGQGHKSIDSGSIWSKHKTGFKKFLGL